MLESAIVGVFGFGNVVTTGRAGEVEREAGELLGKLDDLAQAGRTDDAFKRALLERAGFLLAVAEAKSDGGAWLDAFETGRREAEAMLNGRRA